METAMGQRDAGYAHCGEEARVNRFVFVKKVKLGTFTSL